jgi:hypothetical protein
LSHHYKVKTQFTDREALIAALVACGFEREHIEIHEKPASMVGWYGERSPHKGNLIIRRQHCSKTPGMADYGFILEPDGTYAKVADNYMEFDGRYDGKWQQQLRREYTAARSVAALARQGLRGEITRLPNNKIEIRAAVAVRR